MTNILSGSRMSHQCLDTSPICGHTTYHEMCCSKEHLCIYRHIYIYIVCIYIYRMYYLFLYIKYIYIYIHNLRLLTQSTSRSRAPWHLADLLLGGVPGQAEHVLGDAQKNHGRRREKGGSSGFKAGKTMGKPWESMGEMGFSPKTMEKRWKSCDFWPKLKEGWPCVATNRQKLRQHKLDFHCQGIQFPARALSNMTAAQTYYKFPKLDGSKLQYQTLPTWLDRWCPFTVPYWLSDSIQNTTNSVRCSWFGGQN